MHEISAQSIQGEMPTISVWNTKTDASSYLTEFLVTRLY